MCLSPADVVTKYSNFVSFPLYLNGRRINTLQVRPWAACEGQAAAETLLRDVEGDECKGHYLDAQER